jgi:alpha-beta hydrolase superfamily lysophospholipase
VRHRVTPEIVDFAARDRFGLNFHHYPSIGSGNAGPVIVVHGAGVRALFLPPTEETLVDALLDAGYDVWLLNWRANIVGARPVS